LTGFYRLAVLKLTDLWTEAWCCD